MSSTQNPKVWTLPPKFTEYELANRTWKGRGTICFKPQKIEYGDALYFFLSFLNQIGIFIFIFTLIFRLSYVSFVYRLELNSTNTCIWDFPFILCFFCGDLYFFCFLKRTSMVHYVFYWDLSDSWLDLMFQVFKCLKWRVQPHPSVLNRKKPSMEMLYIFFLAFSIKHVFFFLYLLWSSVHLMFLLFTGLNWRVQTHASEIFRSSFVSFVEIFFCAFSSEQAWFFMFFTEI